MAKKAKKTAATITTTETEPTTTPTTPAPVATTQQAKAPPATTAGTQTSAKGSNVKASKSTLEKPTKAVWAVADELKAANPQVTRKQVVDECVRRGIAFYTARTQYQRWSKTRA